jgi:orotidine-5'-phosphate decarboxylase
MTREGLFEQIRQKKSFLCVGLDTDMAKIPKHLLDTEDPVFSFNKSIIDATAPYAIAYKPNTAFYEMEGIAGWASLEKTINYLNAAYPEIFTIADAKRADIGNTSAAYAHAFLNKLGFDAITVAPYMGKDSVEPFLQHQNKWVILLALTSNPGSQDFQYLKVGVQQTNQLFEHVLMTSSQWAGPDQMMYVVGATHPEETGRIRKLIPDHFLLVPGIGAQGGDLFEIAKVGLNSHCGLIVNSSRAIIYASSGLDFAEKAAIEAQKVQMQMQQLLLEFKLTGNQ